MPDSTYWADWADQLRAELDKQASDRAGTLESLLFSGDWEAINEWLLEWQEEDANCHSLRHRYCHVLELRKAERQLLNIASAKNTLSANN